MGIDELNPCQLAPFVGIGSADVAASSGLSTVIYNSTTSEIRQLFGGVRLHRPHAGHSLGFRVRGRWNQPGDQELPLPSW